MIVAEEGATHAVVTVTLNEHDTALSLGSSAVHVTVVIPTGNDEFDAGTHVTVAEQLSDAVGAVHALGQDVELAGERQVVRIDVLELRLVRRADRVEDHAGHVGHAGAAELPALRHRARHAERLVEQLRAIPGADGDGDFHATKGNFRTLSLRERAG